MCRVWILLIFSVFLSVPLCLCISIQKKLMCRHFLAVCHVYVNAEPLLIMVIVFFSSSFNFTIRLIWFKHYCAHRCSFQCKFKNKFERITHFNCKFHIINIWMTVCVCLWVWWIWNYGNFVLQFKHTHTRQQFGVLFTGKSTAI